MTGGSMAAMIEEAKAEAATLVDLAIDAHNGGFAALALCYRASVRRLASIIAVAETNKAVFYDAALQENKPTVCSKHKRFQPCFVCYKETHNTKGNE